MNTVVYANTDKAEKGFTLLEVLMALAIFSIGILAVASLQISAMLQSRHSSEIAAASAAASDQMDMLILRPFDHSDLNIGNHGPLSSDKYSIQWTVTASELNIPPAATVESKTVALTVSWPGSNQRDVKYLLIKHNQDI